MNAHYRPGDMVTATVGIVAAGLNVGDVYVCNVFGDHLTVTATRRVRTSHGPRIDITAVAENGDINHGLFLVDAPVDLVITDSAL